MNASSVIIRASEVTKTYGTKKNPIRALGPVSFEIKQGSFTVILGRSGSGKSTLLNVMSGLDRVTSGTLESNGHNISSASGRQLAKYRAGNGVIFQFYHLLPNLTAVENVLLGSWAGGEQADRAEAEELLKTVGLDHRINANVKTMSGGEKQRVAIARALMGNPEILFCDEPTGALDTTNEDQIKDMLMELNKTKGITIIMVTHNPEFEHIADNVIRMQDGKIVSASGNKAENSLPKPKVQQVSL